MSIQSSFNQLLGIGAVAAGAVAQSPEYKATESEKALRADKGKIESLKSTLKGTPEDVNSVLSPLTEGYNKKVQKFSQENPDSELASEYYNEQLAKMQAQQRAAAEQQAMQAQLARQQEISEMNHQLANRRAALKKRRNKHG